MRRPSSGPEYQCQAGHVRCRKADLEEYAQAAILAYLARPDLHQRLARSDDETSGELARVRRELATARHELGLLRAEVGAGRLSVASLVTAEPGILARITALEAEETRLATPSVLHGLITPGQDVAARWEQAPIAARREIARLLLAPGLLGELRVDRRPPGVSGRHVPIADRVHWHHNTDTAPAPAQGRVRGWGWGRLTGPTDDDGPGRGRNARPGPSSCRPAISAPVGQSLVTGGR